MKLLVVSGSDSKGGAARIAQTLVQGLRQRHHDVTFLVGSQDDATLESTKIDQPVPSHRTVGMRVIHRLGMNQLNLESRFPKFETAVRFADYDAIHLHDIGTFNLRHLPWLSRQSQLIWTIHSMAPLTGNCIYPFDCDRWKTTCGQCPQFGHWPLHWLHRDGSNLNLRIKRAVYRRSRLHAIGVSQWISDQIRVSAMGHLPVSTIQNSIDQDQFYPVDSQQSKIELGIDPQRFTIAFSVAANPNDTRKGVDLVMQAAQSLGGDCPITFMPMSIGPDDQHLRSLLSDRHEMMSPKHLASSEDLRRYYSAADVIWHPSRADTSSMVSMEAMACGTPVIAARVGGVPEVVGDAGILVDLESPAQLVAATRELMDDPARLIELSSRGLDRVANRFNLDRFINEHEVLYQQAVVPHVEKDVTTNS